MTIAICIGAYKSQAKNAITRDYIITGSAPRSGLIKRVPPQKATELPTSTYYEFPFETKNGEVKWVGQNVQSITREDEIVGFQSIARDITDRKEMEKALQDSEERFRSLIDQAADAIFVHDFDGRILDVNRQSCASLGYTRDELLSMSVPDVDPDAVPRGDGAKFWPNLPATFEAKHKRKDGTTFPVEIRLGAIEYGKSKVLLAMARDLSSRQKAEEALRESEERYRILADNALVGVYLHQDCFFVYANRRLEEMLGYTADELTKMTFWEIFHPDVREKIKTRGLARYRGEQAPSHYVSRIATKDGETRWVEVSAALTEYRGKVATTGALVDITKRRETNKALKKSEKFNRRLVEHAPVGIIYLARDGTVEYANPAASRIAGIPEGQVSPALGKNVLELPGLLDRSKAQDIFRGLLQGESPPDFETAYTSSVGHDTMLLVTAAPRLNLEGFVEGAILMFTDISERKRAEEIQRQTVRVRAVADLARGVAHNFNNLLQIVIGNLELALMDLEAGDCAVVKDGLEGILENARFGAEVVRRLQRFCQQQTKVQPTDMEVFDLSEIARQALEVSQSWLIAGEKEGRNVSLYTKLEEGCLVYGDKNEIFGVVVNLVRNAVEALPTGGDIDVTSGVEGDKVVLQVSDTGIGISEENLGRLFNPFFTTKAEPGAGLSLASGRKIVAECGGQILVDSTEGKGTTLTVLFPRAEKLPGPTKELPERDIEQRFTILVIDDMESITKLLKTALAARGHSVLTALSGEEGIEIFNENSADVVICDLGLPGMTGWEVGLRISTMCQDRGVPKPLFILLTAWEGQEHESEKIAQSGVDAVICKPIRIHNICEVIRQAVCRHLSKNGDG